jgi:hypothetical protein
MFRRVKRQVSASEKTPDERKIETDAYLAVRSSRKQIARAATILAEEVRRLDSVLEKQK